MKPLSEMNWNRQQVKYFLRHWYEFDQRINDLSTFERETVIQLYIRLSYLTDEQRQLLAGQFHLPADQQPSDVHFARSMNISIKELRKTRAKIISLLGIYRSKPNDKTKVADELQRLLNMATNCPIS